MIRKLSILLLFIAGTFSAKAQSTYAEHSLLSTGKWVKISVSNSGVYQLSSSDLKKMGFNDPSKVKLYGYNYPVLPDNCINEISDDLIEMPLYRNAPSGNLLFYSFGTTSWEKSSSSTFTHFNNPYSKTVCYFLTEDTAGSPTEFRSIEASTSDATTQKTTLAHSLYEKDGFSFGNFGRRFYETAEYSVNTSRTYSLDFPKATASKANFDISFGASDNNTSAITVISNGKKKETFTVSSYLNNAVANRSALSFTDTIKGTKQSVILQMTNGGKGHLDYIRASYERKLDISSENYVEFTPNKKGSAVFGIEGTDKNTSVWRIISPDSTIELKGTLNGTTYKVLSKNMSIYDNYIAVNTNASFPSPDYVGKVTNQDLHSMSGVDLLIIIPASGILKSEAERLAAFHTQHDSLKCAVVGADKIYNEFSSGTPDVTAYRRFIKMLYDKGNDGNGKQLKNVILFGTSIADNKMILSVNSKKSPDDYLLCYESDNSESLVDSYILEEYIVCPEDNNDILRNLPEIGLGRIPVTTASDAKNVVDKIISYVNNTYAGNWRNSVCILADDGTGDKGDNAYTHQTYSEKMTKKLEVEFPTYRFSRIYWDTYQRKQTATGNTYPDVENDVASKVQEGALIMNYTGHGSPLCLSHEQAIKIDDFKTWNSPRLPLWITAGCETTPFDMDTDNLGVEAVLNKDGGAIAIIGTTRAVYGDENDDINCKVMKYLLGRDANGKRYTIGEALSISKKEIAENKSDSQALINKSNFVLIGDPAITLPHPTDSIVIDSINGQSVNNNFCKISAGEKVIVKGHMVNGNGDDRKDFTGIISSAIYDNREVTISNNNNKTEDGEFKFSYNKRKLFEGTDSIKNGEFSFTFIVPMDNNYSDDNCRINLYAVNSSHTNEAFGDFRNFTIGGTSAELVVDTIGPNIHTLINSNNTIDGQKVNDTPTIYVNLSDSSGINSAGNGLGHDIVAIIDGKEATTYNLNNYFKQNAGDYTSGTVEFTFPKIEAGSHILTIRAFDTFNNMSEKSYSFEVYENLTKVVEHYDFTGRLLTDTETTHLPKGVYIKKIKYMSNGEEVYHETKKIFLK